LVIPALKIHPGETVAIVGSSGSGKSTLADLVLGLNPVTHGSIQISGMDPREVHLTYPGSLGYVPQEVYISRGSLRKNLTLGFNESDFSDEEIMISLEKSKLLDFTKKLEKGLYTEIGELGNSLSGGEKQRIGVARSLLTNPKLLILDEATSSLDATTESQLSENILQGEGDLTIVIIAHRLATVKSVERLLYLEDGRIIADGDFEFVKKNVPDFLRQANLFGM
jgi:ABC-type multidrug transport system fused ATPase/permease subunit